MGGKDCVIVTGVGGGSVGHQALQALLLADSYRLVATDADRFSFGLYEVEGRYVVPYANSPNYISALLNVVRKEGAKAVIPGTQQEVLSLCEQEALFAAEGCALIVNPAEVVQLCDSKVALIRWLEANGFDTPRTVPADDWHRLVDEVGFPVVGKPSEHRGGSRDVMILKDTEEVQQYLERRAAENLMFQEYVGDLDTEYTVGVLISRTGDLIDSILIHRKLTGLSLGTKRTIGRRAYGMSTGYSQGFVVANRLIQDCCEGLALKIGARGPMNIQCRVHGQQVKIFEVHPRFSGTTSLRADVGFNEPDVLIRNWLFGERFGRLDYQTDVAVIRAFRSIIVPTSVMDEVPEA